MTSAKPSIAIEIDHVSKRYGPKTGIREVNAAFLSGTLHLLVGTNGSGKSTLLKCIMGLVRYEGTIKRGRHRIGYAPEEYVMPQYMAVGEFLAALGKIRGNGEETEEETGRLLDAFGLGGLAGRQIGKLSNGMRQKVNLIQAFLHHPKILLLDEPLRALDAESQDTAVAMIRERMGESLIIVSTHSPERYRVRNRRIWRMEAGTLCGDDKE